MKTGKIFRGDKTIWVVFFLLSVISLIAVYSSIGLYAYSMPNARPTGLFLKHLAIVAATYVAIIFISRINYRYFSRFAMLGYWASLVLLAVMLALHGRWFRLPVIGQFQPSEIAKVVLIIFVARQVSIAKKKQQTEEIGTFLMILVYIAPVVLLVLPENFSTAALIFLSAYLVMLYGGVNRKYWWRLFLVGVVVAIGFLMVSYYKYEKSLNNVNTEMAIERQATWGHRVYSWINPEPDELSQENMAKMAIARGGFARLGVGSTVHARLMTQAHNDFIYAIIIEETGMIGGLIVFALYSIFFFRCIKLSLKCKGNFGALTVAGMGTMIYLQALVNMCVAVGVLPVTGQTLPFISYGGTAYLFLGCGLGVIQSVAADIAKNEQDEKNGVVPMPEEDAEEQPTEK